MCELSRRDLIVSSSGRKILIERGFFGFNFFFSR